MLRMIRTFQKVQHVELARVFRHARRDVMVFVQNQVGVLGAITVWRYLACVDRTFGICEQRST